MPLLKIDYEIGENERKMADHMDDTLEEVGKAPGIELVALQARRARQQRIRDPRARLLPDGRRPETSALNRFNQMHEVKNVFVVDGSAFTSASEKNPTLTILALSWRATDYLGETDKDRNA